MARKLLQSPSPSALRLQLDVVELPRLVEIGLLWAVEPEIREPSPARDCLYPVLRLGGLRGAKVEVHRTVRVRDEALPRRHIGRALVRDNRPARDVIVQ